MILEGKLLSKTYVSLSLSLGELTLSKLNEPL